MLKKILFKSQSKKQLSIAVLGTLIGFVFLLTSVHYFIETNQLGKGDEILGNNLLIVQKKVSKFNTLGLSTSTFSNKEIQFLKNLPYVLRVAPIINNQYKISLGMRQEGLPYFRTDIFLQSVDENLMDVKLEHWTWNHQKKFVPLVMPRDFMVMLNQFAASYGMPQVSEDLAKTIVFRIDVRGNGQKEGFDAKIIGFSNQISAVLVPLSFMEYANKKYGNNKENIISQLMLDLKTGHFGDLTKVFEEQNLEAKKSELIITKVKSILSAVLGLMMAIGLIIIALSAFIVVQYTQLLISKSDYEIKVLMRLGYSPNIITKHFLYYFFKLFGLLFLVSSILFIIIKLFLDEFISKSGVFVGQSYSILSFVILLFIAIGIVLVNYIQVKKTILKKIKFVK